MAQAARPTRLDRPVDGTDRSLGPPEAGVTLVEYGSYACPHCRAATQTIAELRDSFGERMRYVFRNRPLTDNDIARRAAELAERAPDAESFWRAHIALMTRSASLNEDDLRAVAEDLHVAGNADDSGPEAELARRRVDRDVASSEASGALVTPTFFINSRRYEGLWDRGELASAINGSLSHRMQVAALDFARWAPSAGLLLLLATVVALVLTNSPAAGSFIALWQQPLGLSFADRSFVLTLLQWINDGLLTVFFLVVGLEIKREFTVGHLSSLKSAALPIAAALGGMVVPVLLYRMVLPEGPWAHGWGVPMATDTAFAVAVIVMMGSRVPVELRVFLTAAAIVDDIGAVIVVALFYSGALHLVPLLLALATIAALAVLNHARVYRVAPYLLLGLMLWICVHEGGLHATLAGVILAFFIPTREPPNLGALTAQTSAILMAAAKRSAEVLRHGPPASMMQALDAIHDRLEAPADRMLRLVSLRSNYFVLPVFALANAGVVLGADVLHGHGRLTLAIVLGLVLGKPLGMFAAAALASRLGLAVKPDAYSWRQLLGAGALAGIGFTMSLFIAGQAFPVPADFAAAKVAIFAASLLAVTAGIALLWSEQGLAVRLPRRRGP